MKNTYTLQTRSGILIDGSSPHQVVEKMKESARFQSDLSLEEYMKDVAEREIEYSGQSLSTESTDAFVKSALAAGLLQERPQ